MEAVLAKIEHDAPDILELAGALLAEHGHLATAADALAIRVRSDPRLLDQLLERYLGVLCRQILGRIANSDRAIALGAKVGAPRAVPLNTIASELALGLMDTFRLPGGQLIGDARRADLSKAAMSYQVIAEDANVKRSWFSLIAKQLPDEITKVREAMTDAQLEKFKKSALEGCS